MDGGAVGAGTPGGAEGPKPLAGAAAKAEGAEKRSEAAAAGAAIGEKVGLGKECATWLASGGVGDKPTTGGTCDTSSGGEYVATWSGTANGLKCLNTALTSTVESAKITVSTAGTMSCAGV